jgi:hypothetical protein
VMTVLEEICNVEPILTLAKEDIAKTNRDTNAPFLVNCVIKAAVEHRILPRSPTISHSPPLQSREMWPE